MQMVFAAGLLASAKDSEILNGLGYLFSKQPDGDAASVTPSNTHVHKAMVCDVRLSFLAVSLFELRSLQIFSHLPSGVGVHEATNCIADTQSITPALERE